MNPKSALKNPWLRPGEIIQYTSWEDALEYHNDVANEITNPFLYPAQVGLVISYDSRANVYLVLSEGRVQEIPTFLTFGVDAGSTTKRKI
jgi:hypothetical protein